MNALYLQGFVWGIKSKDLHKKDIKNYIIKNKINMIVWDGDLLSNGSFTQLIEYINEKFSYMNFLAFKKNTSTHKFHKNYKETDKFGNILTGFTFINKKYPIIFLNQKKNDKFVVVGISPTKIKSYDDISILAYNYLIKNNINIHIITLGQGNIIKKFYKKMKIKPQLEFNISR